MKNCRIILFVLLSFSVSSVFAQGSQLFTSLDAMAFSRGADSVQLEVYYSIVEKALQFKQVGSKWVAPIAGTVIIKQDGKEITHQDINKTKSVEGSKKELDAHQADVAIDGMIFKVAAKSNTEAIFVFHGQDQSGKPTNDTISRQVLIPILKKDKFQFSGIELASSLEQTSNKSNIFEKVGYIIMPNPSNTFGGNYQKLFYYTELSIPGANISPDSKAEVQLRILDAEQHEMYKNTTPVVLSASTIPVIGTAQIDGLPSDSYIIELSLIKNGTVEARVQRVFFYDSGFEVSEEEETQAPSVVDEETIYLSSDLSKLSELEVEERATQSFYMTTSTAPKKEYEKLTDLDKKRRFLYAFWRERDKQLPKPYPLAAYKEFMKRVEDANRQFSFMKTAGWKTSRGRVLIRYGKPDQINPQPFNIDTKPYTTWEYAARNLQLTSGSRAQFVFVDKQGGGNYILVHSNVLGETSNPDWYTRDALQTAN